MTWKLSRFRTGGTVEVRSKEEILATLDQRGSLDRLPFMPEMLQYCGQRFRVGAVAHKTRDTARQTWTNRRLDTTVHLAGLRCDGSAHGGCQAECNLFWKDAWLKPVAKTGLEGAKRVEATNTRASGCTQAQLLNNTQLSLGGEGDEPIYSCQATQMYEATQALAWWDVRQYVFDVTAGNHSAGRVFRVLFLASLRWLRNRILRHMPWAHRFFKPLNERMHQWLTGRASPSLNAQIPDGQPTPTGRLNLKPGEYVRIKAQLDIEQTVDKKGMNRGLGFDLEEMAPYCGRVVTVHKAVTQIIHEPTGKMLHMKQPCIMLEGVVCKAEYARCRLNCPREIPSYWRELWLDRVEDR
ncbi:MAG: hypothetical protein ACREBC_25205 [Pyrinomonadaceae bacterium]